MDYTKLTVKQLTAKCNELNLSNYKGKKKAQLIDILTQSNTSLHPEVHLDTTQEEEAVSIEVNNVYLGNCIALFKSMASSSVDMICTDPPYFLDGLGSDWSKKAIDKKGSSSVVGNLPKGMKFDRNQSKQFREFYLTVSQEAYRVLKPGGVFISFSSPRLYHAMTIAIEDAGFEIRDMLGWVYTQSQVKAFSQDHIINKDKSLTDEEKSKILEQCKDTRTMQLKPAIEPMCLAVKPVEGRLVDNYVKYGTGLMHVDDETKVGMNENGEQIMFPANIMTTEMSWEAIDRVFLVPKPTKKEKGDYNSHLSVKPVSLISHLIKLFTKKDAIVVDPFMGSGTTAVACRITDRNYIGFELNQEYIDITKKRLAELDSNIV